MNIIAKIVLTMVLAYILELFFPWYSIAIAAFIAGYTLRTRLSFLAGFIAIFLLWTLKALIIDLTSASDLATRVAQIFPVQHKVFLYLLMGTLGGLIGGFACMTGAIIQSENRKSFGR
jgi:hypothetical protein